MPKLTSRDKSILIRMGYNKEDVPDIENAEYKYFSNYDRRTNERCAIRSLGRKAWLLGIGRARFHHSAVRDCKTSNNIIYIVLA